MCIYTHAYNYNINYLVEFNVYNTVRCPSRITDHTIKTSDHVYRSFESGPCFVLDNIISDHRSAFMETNLNTLDRVRKICFVIVLTKIQCFCWNTLLLTENWNKIYSFPSIDSTFIYFYETFLYYFNVHFSVRQKYKVLRKLGNK